MDTTSNGLLQRILRRVPILRSQKAYIFILMLAIGVIPSVVMRAGILESYEKRAVSVRTSDVTTQYRIIADHLLNYNYLQDTSSEVINAELEQMSNLYDGRVMIISGNFRIVKDTYAISEGRTMISEEVIKCFNGESTSRHDRENGYIEMTVPIVETKRVDGKTVSQVRGVILASASTDSIVATMELMRHRAMILEIVMTILILGIVPFLAHILTLPFSRVTRAINEVRDGYTDREISVPDYIETEHIADAFNQLLGRIRSERVP